MLDDFRQTKSTPLTRFVCPFYMSVERHWSDLKKKITLIE